jgi:hypothetical protein
MIDRRDPILAAAISLASKDYATKIILEFPELDRELVSNTLQKIIDVFQEDISRISQSTFAIKLAFSTDCTAIGAFDLSTLSNALSKDINAFIINPNLDIVSYDNLTDLSDASVSQYSKNSQACVLYVFGAEMIIFAKGYLVKHINIQKPLIKDPTRLNYGVDAHNYELAIKNHFQKIRFGGIHSDHWQDRDLRILRAKPTKTEKLFHMNLWRWLDANLNDADVLGEVQKISNDRTDIEIRVRRDGTLYIIEVKWLGVNENKTEYKEDRVRKGISQVNNYIEREKFQSEVCLVAYDGRSEDEFNALDYICCEPGQWKEIRECQGEKLKDNGRGFVFFLESKTASM